VVGGFLLRVLLLPLGHGSMVEVAASAGDTGFGAQWARSGFPGQGVAPVTEGAWLAVVSGVDGGGRRWSASVCGWGTRATGCGRSSVCDLVGGGC
jgi:hypothetical protein